MKNTIGHSVLEGNPELNTTKKDKIIHGFGTKIINDIAKKYNGAFRLLRENGYFICRINIEKQISYLQIVCLTKIFRAYLTSVSVLPQFQFNGLFQVCSAFIFRLYLFLQYLYRALIPYLLFYTNIPQESGKILLFCGILILHLLPKYNMLCQISRHKTFCIV